MSLTLYGVAASRAARPLWMLEELAVQYDHVGTHYLRGESRQPEILARNPTGRIPGLVGGEVVRWESMAINLYLARRSGGRLAAADLAEEARRLRGSLWAMAGCDAD